MIYKFLLQELFVRRIKKIRKKTFKTFTRKSVINSRTGEIVFSAAILAFLFSAVLMQKKWRRKKTFARCILTYYISKQSW